MTILEGCLQYEKATRISPYALFSLLQLDTLYSNYSKLDLGGKSNDK